jgi:RNA polymerase sigma-B factor
MSHEALAPSPEHRLDPDHHDDLTELFVELRRTGDVRIRNDIVERHLHLADWCARRYGDGTMREDLHQVARMAVVHATERFDPDLGISFRTFASRTIEGECKRFLRDRSWNVRPPRALLELALAVRREQEELGHALGRAPTLDELAEHLDTTVERVVEAIEAYGARRSVPMEPERPEQPGGAAIMRRCSTVDPGYDAVEGLSTIAPALSRLEPRERELLFLRFVERRSQSDLAKHFNLSQSYISRFLASTLLRLRHEVGPC